MLFFDKNSKKNTKRVGVVVDVGSASVGIAIVVSEISKKDPTIVWSYKERFQETQNVSLLEKHLKTAILNAFLTLSSTGLPTLTSSKLFQKNEKIHPDLIQVSISAPFSYTIAHNTIVQDNSSFKVSKALIAELKEKSLSKIKKKADSSLFNKILKLKLLSNSIVSLRVNDYWFKLTKPVFGKKLSVNQIVAFGHEPVVQQIYDVSNKILPDVPLDIDSFMSLFFRTFNKLSPKTKGAGLISVTADATEFCFIDEGVPGNSFFIKEGQYSIAREISKETGLIMSESLSFLKENDVNPSIKLNAKKQTQVDKIIEDYRSNVVTLLKSINDKAILPKVFYLHTDKFFEEFFIKELTKTIKSITGKKPTIYPVTSKVFDFSADQETSLLASAFVFHKKLYEDNYEF